MTPPNKPSRFDSIADDALNQLYASVGAKTPDQKINLLKVSVGGDVSFMSMGKDPTPEMLLACLEYDYLSNSGLLDNTPV